MHIMQCVNSHLRHYVCKAARSFHELYLPSSVSRGGRGAESQGDKDVLFRPLVHNTDRAELAQADTATRSLLAQVHLRRRLRRIHGKHTFGTFP